MKSKSNPENEAKSLIDFNQGEIIHFRGAKVG
jgi:hypothetical protein